jgi:hypothetical protein
MDRISDERMILVLFKNARQQISMVPPGVVSRQILLALAGVKVEQSPRRLLNALVKRTAALPPEIRALGDLVCHPFEIVGVCARRLFRDQSIGVS